MKNKIETTINRLLAGKGTLTSLTQNNGQIDCAIEINPQDAPTFEPLRQQIEQTLQSLDGIQKARVILTAHKKPKPTPAPEKYLPLPNIKKIIAVASGKGGVGKSTTAVNLAVALASLGLKTGLLDADIYGPSIPRMMNLQDKPETTPDKKMIPLENHGVKTMSIGFLIPEESPTIWRGPIVMGAVTQLLRDVDWGDLDVMVIDLPPGTGDVQLTLTQRVPLAGAIIVSTPQDIALLDARKAFHMFEKVNVPILGIIENMSLFTCPNCGHESHIFAHGGAENESKRLGTEFLGALPLDIQIRQTSDDGKPITASDPENPASQTYRKIATTLRQKLGL